MTDLSSPPAGLADVSAVLPSPPEPTPASATDIAAAPSALAWPASPAVGVAPLNTAAAPEPCEVISDSGKARKLLLCQLWPEPGLAEVMVPPSRERVNLRLAQCQRLMLTTPVRVHSKTPDVQPFEVTLSSGDAWRGDTCGHVAHSIGLFLFVYIPTLGALRRVLIPAAALAKAVVAAQPVVLPAPGSPAEPPPLTENERRRQRVDQALASKPVTTLAELDAALAAQSAMPLVRIGEALTSLGLITSAQLDAAIAQQRQVKGVPLGQLLVQAGHVTQGDLRVALARKMGYPIVDVAGFPVQLDALRLVPVATALKLHVVPLALTGSRLVVAMADASRRDVIDEIQFLTQNKVVPVLSTTEEMATLTHLTYERHGLDDAGGDRDAATALAEGATDELLAALEVPVQDMVLEETAIEQSDNSLVKLINSMIVKAHAQGVSDIHIETHPGREKVAVRFRKDGALRPYLELPHTYRGALIARIKIMCDLDISEKRRPQDGKINFARFVPGCQIELRVATIPTSNGLEDVVMRILASAKPIPLDNLGMSPRNLDALKDAVTRPYGMVLCVGPTGSGKTTTLHSALAYINTPDRKIWTAEDPVEITQAGLRQVQVNPKIEWTFAKALRSFLRADPDVIMVGEIRDHETAEIAVESSLTGHLVLSTLHTNSAPETITRLLDMGMDPFNFADSLLAVLAQRLVRRLCSGCRTNEPMSDDEEAELLDTYLHSFPDANAAPSRDALRTEWVERFGQDGRLQRWHCAGCEACEGSGLKGRAGLHELLAMSRPLRRLIQTGGRAEEIQKLAMAEGMRTLRQDGIEKVLAGVTSMEEVRGTSNA